MCLLLYARWSYFWLINYMTFINYVFERELIGATDPNAWRIIMVTSDYYGYHTLYLCILFASFNISILKMSL